jgi:hypothetical protein
MELMIFRVSGGSGKSGRGLHGRVVTETKTSYLVSISKNESIKLWFPKNSLANIKKIKDVDSYYICKLKSWYTGNEYFSRMWDTYSELYKL